VARGLALAHRAHCANGLKIPSVAAFDGFRSASAFMCATISTSPLAASVATQVTRPDASNLGWNFSPSSRSLLSEDVDTVGPRKFDAKATAAGLHMDMETRLLRWIVAEHAVKRL